MYTQLKSFGHEDFYSSVLIILFNKRALIYWLLGCTPAF